MNHPPPDESPKWWIRPISGDSSEFIWPKSDGALPPDAFIKAGHLVPVVREDVYLGCWLELMELKVELAKLKEQNV